MVTHFLYLGLLVGGCHKRSDGRGSSITTKESQTPCHIGPITRVMARRLEEDWNTATDGR